MTKIATINFLDGDYVNLYEDTYIQAIKSISDEKSFYTQITFSGTFYDSRNSMKDLTTVDPAVGLLGLFADSDFFKLSENQELFYNSSSIKSISFD